MPRFPGGDRLDPVSHRLGGDARLWIAAGFAARSTGSPSSQACPAEHIPTPGDCVEFAVSQRPAQILRMHPHGFYEKTRRKLQLQDSSELAPR